MNDLVELTAQDHIEMVRWLVLEFLEQTKPHDPADYLATLMDQPEWTQVIHRQWCTAYSDSRRGRLTLRELGDVVGQPFPGDPGMLPIEPEHADFVTQVFEEYGKGSLDLTNKQRMASDVKVATLVLASVVRTLSPRDDEPHSSREEMVAGLRGDDDPLGTFEYLARVWVHAVPGAMGRRPPWATDKVWDCRNTLCGLVDADLAPQREEKPS